MKYSLHKGDCLEVMATLPDASIDCVITDPPYGTTACKWDSVIPFEPMWKELERITKPKAAICLFGSQPFTSALVMSSPKMFRQNLIWEKTRPVNVMNAKKMFMNYHEDVLVFYDELPTFNPQMIEVPRYTKVQHLQDRSNGHLGKTGERDRYFHDNGGLKYPTPILKFSNVCRPHVHPTQKPVDLLRYLVRTYTNEGETVLDFTMGSGSTGVACLLENRNFIGIEKDENYFKIAERRMVEAMNKEPLLQA